MPAGLQAVRLPAAAGIIVPIFNHQFQILNSSGNYNYIICGAGCAGLSLLMHMIESNRFKNKRILLVDKEEKDRNDRTWCFWEKSPGLFEPVVYKKWERLWFHGEGFSNCFPVPPYEYKMIRGIDFYTYCFDIIRRQENITVLRAEVKEIENMPGGVKISVSGEADREFHSDYVFNSISFKKPLLKKNEYYLLQHFKGWVVETPGNSFDPASAILMDFRISQDHGTTFVYVMPFSGKKALIEYTLFSPSQLKPEQYDEGLKEYISQQLEIGEYRIVEEERGVIPMTNHRFPFRDGNIIYIGTAGGQTKASSGYTFRFIQKNSAAIVQQLIRSGHPFVKNESKRFLFYDSVLLNILYNNRIPGKKIFTDLFKKNKPQSVLRFLDNESSFSEELRIFTSLPTIPFLKAALRQI